MQGGNNGMAYDESSDAILISDLELTVATAIENADPEVDVDLNWDDRTSPLDWIPEARAAILSIVQLLRHYGGGGAGRYAAGWLEAASWLEDQLVDRRMEELNDTVELDDFSGDDDES